MAATALPAHIRAVRQYQYLDMVHAEAAHLRQSQLARTAIREESTDRADDGIGTTTTSTPKRDQQTVLSLLNPLVDTPDIDQPKSQVKWLGPSGRKRRLQRKLNANDETLPITRSRATAMGTPIKQYVNEIDKCCAAAKKMAATNASPGPSERDCPLS